MPARILVIEDNPANLALVEYLLRAAGHVCASATDGTAGVRLALDAPPDLVLCDLQMPELDGYGVLERLRAEPRTRAIPVIAVTAFSTPGDQTRVIEAGFDAYLSKPIDPELFMTQVEAYLPPALRGRPLAGPR